MSGMSSIARFTVSSWIEQRAIAEQETCLNPIGRSRLLTSIDRLQRDTFQTDRIQDGSGPTQVCCRNTQDSLCFCELQKILQTLRTQAARF